MDVRPVILTMVLLPLSDIAPALRNKGVSVPETYYGVEQDLKILCPEVNICNQNGTQPRGQAAGETGYAYCCKRCSCHEDCHDNMDCCFPNGNNITVPGKRYSTKECLYVQTGSPQDKWPIDVPAFRIVTSSPEGGCKANVTCPALAGRNSTASCDRMGLWSWGDLFPVYSNEHGEIYINGLCACCHGADKYESWQPHLICETKSSNKMYLMNDHLRVLERDFNTSHCYILFRNSTPKDLQDKRCYVNTTSSCNSAFKFQVPSRSNLTSDEIVEACKFGPNAPVPGEMEVYKNVYCAVCNGFKMQRLADCTQLATNDLTRFIYPPYSIVLVLHAGLYQSDMAIGTDRKKPDQPQVCWAEEGSPTSKKKCKDVLCPSGQTRYPREECMFTAMIWSKVLFKIFIKLECTSKGKDIKHMILDRDISHIELGNIIHNSSPWPIYWMVIGIFLDVSEVHDDRFVIVQLGCGISNTAPVYRDVKTSMDLPWNFIINNATYLVQQGFLESVKFYYRGQTAYPAWFRYKKDIEKKTRSPTNQAFYALIKIWFTANNLHSEYLNKLFFCDQVLLAPNEFVLLASETVLVSELTTNTLFDAEFELIPDENGLVSTRVCLSDCVFKSHSGANRLYNLRYTYVIALFFVCTVFDNIFGSQTVHVLKETSLTY